jgi:DNA-binding response OmpR family regulator
MGEVIVLADDEADLRAIYAEVLRRDGHDVWEAADGDEAVALVTRHQPSLLLLDVWMPATNGMEVLDRLRNEPAAIGMKVVMLSNLTDADTRLEGFSSGVADYWVKGLSIEDFRDRIRRVLAGTTAAPGPF